MSSPPKQGNVNIVAASVVGLFTFAAAAWAAYPQGLGPLTVALLAGGCALIPFGLTLMFTGGTRVGAAVSCVGLLVAVSTQAPSLMGQLDRAQPGAAPPTSVQPSPTQLLQPTDTSTDPPKAGKKTGKATKPRQSATAAAATQPAADVSATPTATSPASSPSKTPVRNPRKVSFVRFDLLGTAINQAEPRITASVSGGPDGSQRVAVFMESLGRGPIEWSLYAPNGGTVLGGSFASPQDTATRTYDLHPQATGTYTVTVANKSTGRQSSSTLVLSEDTRSPIVLAAPTPTRPALTVASSDNTMCAGTNVILQLSDVGPTASVHLDLVGAGTADMGVGTDSAGNGVIGFHATADTCTGREETAGTMSVTDAAGAVILSMPLVLAN